MAKQRLPFKKVWTKDLAYAVGLLVTYGCLSKDRRHITMRSSDRDLLETFCLCLKLNNKIAKTYDHGLEKRPSYRVQFGNVQFYNWLISIGVTPAKSLTIGPIEVPDKFFIDFLRGHLDGDGSIFTYQDNYNIYKGKRYLNTRIYTKFISASEKHIKWLHKMIKKHLGVQGMLLHKKPTGNSAGIWEIKFAKYESLKLFTQIYYKKNLPSLKRKEEKARKFLSQVSNQKLIYV